MNKWKDIMWKILFPGTFLIFVMVNASVVLLLYVFLGEECQEAIAYFSYLLSAYALTVVCARMPGIIKKFKTHLYGNKYTGRYFTEKELRIKISLYSGLGLNICFAVFKVVMGVLYQSKWLFAMAGYNTILSIMRFVLVKRDMADRRHMSEAGENVDEVARVCRNHGIKSYHVCGWLMLLLNMAISVIVGIVVFDNQEISYPGFMIYAIAAYAFYCLTMAIMNMVRYWRRDNIMFAAVKRIEMAKALVSIFTLQVALLTQFGNAEGFENRMANGATGLAVCVIIMGIAILMIKGARFDWKQSEKII